MKTLASIGYGIIGLALCGLVYYWFLYGNNLVSGIGIDRIIGMIGSAAVLVAGALLVAGTEVILAGRKDRSEIYSAIKSHTPRKD